MLVCGLLAVGAATRAYAGFDPPRVPAGFVRQIPRPGIWIQDAPPVLYVGGAGSARQVLLCWKEPPPDLAAAAAKIVSEPTDSCLVEWTGEDGGRVKEYWRLDRALGLLVSPDPMTWYVQTYGQGYWGFECKALGVQTSGREYSPLNLDRSADDAALRALNAPPAHLGVPDSLGPGPHPARNDSVWVERLPEAMGKVPPEYPDEAQRLGEDGDVLIKALIDKDGKVAETYVIQSCPDFDGAALAAIKQWQFKPALSRGQAVAVWVMVPFRFTIH